MWSLSPLVLGNFISQYWQQYIFSCGSLVFSFSLMLAWLCPMSSSISFWVNRVFDISHFSLVLSLNEWFVIGACIENPQPSLLCNCCTLIFSVLFNTVTLPVCNNISREETVSARSSGRMMVGFSEHGCSDLQINLIILIFIHKFFPKWHWFNLSKTIYLKYFLQTSSMALRDKNTDTILGFSLSRRAFWMWKYQDSQCRHGGILDLEGEGRISQ